MNEWISVKDRLPDECAEVLACFAGNRFIGFIDESGLWRNQHMMRPRWEVTHWQPLPQPPEQESDDGTT